MGSVPAELSLDIRASSPTFVPKTITDFLCDLSTLPRSPDKLSRLNEFLARLEDEFSKIHAFKRELPLSMLLLNDAIAALKEESEKCRAHKSRPVLEEFIPLKKEFDQSEEEEEPHHPHHHLHRNKDNKECRDNNNNNKKTWLSSVQLWNTPTINNNAYDHKQQQQQQQHHHHKLLETKPKKNEEQVQSVGDDLFQSCRNRGGGGGRGFMPFSTSMYSSVPATTVTLAAAAKEEKEDSVFNSRLTLLTPAPAVKSLIREGSGSSGSRSSSNRAVSSSSPPTAQPCLRTTTAPPLQPHHQTARKQRRCWSPELHRRFVNALQKLGGSQVATPKQIRELMQVDGLTNDEVKSHLQKYRLHTRRVPSASANNQSVVVLGGLWMSQGQQEQYNDSSKGSSSGSGSPQSPLHLAGGSRGGTSPTEEGDSMEDDEDAKSESYSWKSHIHKQPGKVDV